MHVAAIVAAGGLGTRLGTEKPKQFLDLGDGTMMLDRVIETFGACALVRETVVALPAGSFGRSENGQPSNSTATFVEGGPRRQDSVRNALDRVSDDADLIVIHDAARPFVTVELIERTIHAANKHGAAIAAVPVTDTVKVIGRVSGEGVRVIQSTVPRETVFLAQTPQAFRRELLEQAMEAAPDMSITDEAMLVERAGLAVHIVEGDAGNIKVTTQDDYAKARARVLGGTMRIGTGYDLHRLVDGRPLILAGVRIPFDRGLQGHSDADIVSHAVTDAILGAAAAGDIGRLFPDTDAKWKGADSIQLLAAAYDVIRTAGFRVANVDVTVIAERPKLLPYLEEMQNNLSRALGITASAVSIKGKTNEGVDAIGRGEAMACHAVALVVKA
jgi:2-C-methyl-D-erythritol 4-phosphate cytidylyltransferase/2-C-methyl-D-erythritol 2,4-cyclodiphosphate synthase